MHLAIAFGVQLFIGLTCRAYTLSPPLHPFTFFFLKIVNSQPCISTPICPLYMLLRIGSLRPCPDRYYIYNTSICCSVNLHSRSTRPSRPYQFAGDPPLHSRFTRSCTVLSSALLGFCSPTVAADRGIKEMNG